MQYFYYHADTHHTDSTTNINDIILFENKGSKFLALLYALPPLPQDTDSHNVLRNVILTQLKEIHKKAVHFVWAFRILNEYGHIIEGSSDDGEPKGSAGVPILEVLRGKCLINTLCICVRYFGGTKLGVGGLVRSYTQATLQAIAYADSNNQIRAYKKQSSITINDKSSIYNKIVHLTKKYQLTITNKVFMQADMTLQLQGEMEHITCFLHEYNNIKL